MRSDFSLNTVVADDSTLSMSYKGKFKGKIDTVKMTP